MCRESTAREKQNYRGDKMIGELKRNVSIIGVGCTPFGDVLKTPEIKGMTMRELYSWACLEAMEDAGIEAKDIDAFFIGQCMGETLCHQFAPYSAVAEWIGMRNKPGFHHESACSTTNAGLTLAALSVASGRYDIVLSGGVEITNSRPKEGMPACYREAMSPGELWYKTNYGADQAYWYPTGLAVGAFGDVPTMAYAKKYGLSLEQMEDALNAAAINNRRNAVRNPLATISTKEFKDEAREHGFDDVMEYMKSKYNPYSTYPLRVFNCATPVDGASALIVCPSEMAKKFTDTPIDVIGFGTAVGVLYRETEAYWQMDKAAFEQAYKMAKIDPKNIDYMHCHDCMVNSHFMVSEEAGYFPKGEAWKAIIEGRTAFDGDKPISTTGGRTSLGHAWAASAGAEITEAVRQMRGECDKRQIKPEPELCVVHNWGHGPHCNISVLRRR